MGRLEKINHTSVAEKPDMAMEAEKSDSMCKESISESNRHSLDSSSTFSKHSTPPPPYFNTYFISPRSFKATINARRDEPAISLLRLALRLLQLAFALASGISYAIELTHDYSASNANFIFAEVVFGLTLVAIIADSVTVRNYRFTWAMEWAMTMLWAACFGVFYQLYLDGEVPADYAVVDFGRMEFAGWCNLVNALLWLGSALFSSVMCCAGVKAAVQGRLEKRRQRKEDVEVGTTIGKM